MTKISYHRVRAGVYSFPRHSVQRFVTDEETYWTVTNINNGEQVRVDNFGQAKYYIAKLEQGDTNE